MVWCCLEILPFSSCTTLSKRRFFPSRYHHQSTERDNLVHNTRDTRVNECRYQNECGVDADNGGTPPGASKAMLGDSRRCWAMLGPKLWLNGGAFKKKLEGFFKALYTFFQGFIFQGRSKSHPGIEQIQNQKRRKFFSSLDG